MKFEMSQALSVNGARTKTLFRDTVLSFIPFIGMILHYGDEALTVKSVQYEEKTNVFDVIFEPMNLTQSEFDLVVSELKENGWTDSLKKE